MKLNKFRTIMITLTLCRSFAFLTPTLLMNHWVSQRVVLDGGKIVVMLIALGLVFTTDILLVLVRENFALEFNISNLKKYLTAFFALKFDVINEKGPSNLIERIALSVNSIYSYYTGDHINIYANGVVLLALLTLLTKMNIMVGLILLASIPINFLGFRLLNKELLKRSQTMKVETSKGWQDILSIANQVDFLKQSSTFHNILGRHLAIPTKRIYGSMAQINKFAQTSSRAIHLYNAAASTMTMILVVYNYAQSNASPLMIAFYAISLPLFFASLSEMVNANLYKRDFINSMRFFEELESNAEPDGSKIVTEIKKVEFDIKNLTVNDKVLSGPITGVFEKGDVVKVNGPSGAGKSTLVRLLPKFRQTDGVFLNDEDIRVFNNSSLRKRIAYLSQGFTVVTGTLKDNLFLNKELDALLEEKYKADQLLATIFKNKELDDSISEKGANLSEGEKQKLALARSLYDDVDVLILDEVTSNIDQPTAEEIYQRFLKDHENRIVFIISHDDAPDHLCNKSILIPEAAVDVIQQLKAESS